MRRTLALLTILSLVPAFAVAQHVDTPPEPFSASIAYKDGATLRGADR